MKDSFGNLSMTEGVTNYNCFRKWNIHSAMMTIALVHAEQVELDSNHIGNSEER